MAVLANSRLIRPSEVEGTRAVLDAAALTYVAGALSAIMQLLYFLHRAGVFGGRSDEA